MDTALTYKRRMEIINKMGDELMILGNYEAPLNVTWEQLANRLENTHLQLSLAVGELAIFDGNLEPADQLRLHERLRISDEDVVGKVLQLPENERLEGIMDGILEYCEDFEKHLRHSRTQTILSAPDIAVKGIRLQEPLGQGGFGAVYHSIVEGGHEAIKTSEGNAEILALMKESLLYEGLKQSNAPGVPDCKGFFSMGQLMGFLRIELLGPSLKKLTADQGGELSLVTICVIAPQLIGTLQYLHNLPDFEATTQHVDGRWVHQDIKPHNLVGGRNHSKGIVHVVDYGLADKYDSIPEEGQEAIQRKEIYGRIGTYPWAPMAAHEELGQHPKDDLESLGYTLCQVSSIGWPTEERNWQWYLHKKQLWALNGYNECEACPPVAEYMRAVHELPLGPLPVGTYEYLMNIFIMVLIEQPPPLCAQWMM